MNGQQKLRYLLSAEDYAKFVMASGNDKVEEAIIILGRIIDNSPCRETIATCEKLIEMLNEGPAIRNVNQLSNQQAYYASKVMSAVCDCVTLSV